MYESRPLAGLAGILFLVAALGALATFGFSNTDLANGITRSAEARALDEQTRIDTEKSQIDLEIYRQQSQFQLEKIQIDKEKQRKQAEIDLAQMEDNYQINAEQQRIRAQQQLEFERLARLSVLAALTLFSTILILGFGYRLWKRELLVSVSDGRSKVSIRKSTTDPWHANPVWRQEQIRLARQREQEARVAHKAKKVRLSRATDPKSGFSKEEDRSSKDLPLAE